MRRVLLALMASGWLAGGTVAAQNATRQVTGTVVEEGSNAPIPSAQLQVRGTTVGALSRADGSFTITAPTGEVVLDVRRLGYPPVSVTVAAGASTVQIVMRKDALKLDQVVITGQATGISRRNLPNSVASVSAEQVSKVSSPSVDQALQGKVAGAQISTSTGAPGGGNRVRIRGISSILGSAQPLYVIDGVITSDVGIGQGTNLVTRASGSAISAITQEAPVNRISDINPNDIESIDVLKGSAAAAIYGSKASGGVIIITTKRGAAGRPQFNLRTGLGTGRLAYRNGQRKFLTVEDATKAFGPLAASFYDPNRELDYEDLAYGNEPLNREATLSVSGGSQDTRYFISGNARREEGIVKNTYSQKMGLRINVDQRLSERMELQVGTEVLRTLGDRGLFGNDNAGNSIAYTLTKIPSFLDLRQKADGSWPVNPFYNSNPLHTIDLIKNEEGVWRNISTARLTWDLLATKKQELRFVGFGGTDVLNQANEVYSSPVLQYEPLDGLPGTSTVGAANNTQANVNLNLVHVWRPLTRWTATTQFGTQYERRKFNESRASAQNLLGGLEVVTSGTVRDVAESRVLTEDFGLFGQTELLYNDRLFLTLGARADRSSNNGDAGQFYLFPKASASYRLPGLMPGLVDELKLRIAYGETGNQPLYGQRFTALASSNIGGLGAFRIGTGLGAADIRPERQREFEAGIDATIFGNRGTMDFTGFQRNISDLLITRTLPPTSGYSSEISNGAEMKVWGLEASVSVNPVQRAGLTWNTRLNWGMNRSEITSLPVPAFLLGTFQVGAVRVEKGKSATQLIGNDTLPQSPRTLYPNGVLMGDGNPDWTAGWSNEVRMGPFSAYALLDHQQGGMLANGTWRHYDLGQNSRDFDDPGPVAGQKLGDYRRSTYLVVTGIYYQQTTYTKLREVTLGYDLPASLVQRAWGRAQSARLQLSGRNLYWWTDYRGGDPEAQNFGAGNVPDAVQRNRELAPYPASRTFWLNFNVEF
ncbi:MAG: SusC/RagA family TonB-linked outer membrane protein [Gemmatimonadetes bacterium]|nr:SusC/RagA family TonB-linked outer membrane protein [Gemmatimonadota bacterium]MCC6773910.1 SusC/RagA family TonB-linked outer membrane protein [Gemmatimonadaceae bacterium]